LKNKHEKTPLQWADDFDQHEVVKVLREAGGDPPVEPVLPPMVSWELADDLMLTVKQVG
jgi:ankyrin repeat protein